MKLISTLGHSAANRRTAGGIKAIIGEGKPAVIARVEAILVSDGWLQGGHDDRGSGKAAGY